MSGLQSLRALMLVLVAVAVAVDAASNIPRPAANGLSHSGNEFLLAFLENDPADPGAETVTIYVSTDEPTPVNFTVETDSRFSPSLTSGTASYGSTMPVTFSITDPNDIRVTIVTSSSDINDQIDSRSIRVKAEDGKKITVFGVNDKTVSNDAFLALPCQSYNGVTTNTPYEYFIFSTNQNPGLRPNYRSAFLIVTCEDSTAITVRPSETALFQQGQMFNLIPQPQGSLNANARQTIVINTDNSEKDLTGTIVTSTKPISIFSGHVCGRVPADQTACDHLIEQVPPHMVWGTTFFTVPLALRRSGDRFRVGAIRDNTVINVTCVTRGSSTVRFRDSVIRNRSPTPPGSNYYQFQTPGTSPTNPDPNFERDYCCIQTNYPVSVVQYSEGHSADELPEQRGDPFMMLVPPVEQSLNNFTVSTPASNRFEDYINIAVSTEFFNNSAADQAKVQLNGATVTPVGGSWTPITCYDDSICGYGAQVSLSDGASTVVFDDPSGGMNVYTYGFGTEVTYGYPGGFKMEPIGFAHVTLSPVNITVPESAGMVNIQVIRSGDISLRSRVYFNTRSTPTISATAGASCSSTGSDYVQPAQGTADRPSNTRRKRFRDFQTISVLDGPNITIPICNDDVPEGTETFEVYLTDENLQNAYFFPYRVATVTILDDDGNFSVQFDPASYTVDEADGVVSITIVADRAAPSANDGAALFYTMDGTATAGNDFTGITSANAIPVRFPVGSRNTTVTVPITNDGEFEGMEQFFGRLRRSSTAPANFRIPVDTATVLITEAVTAVTVEFDPTSYTVSESDRYANITVVKRGQTTQTVSVTFSTADGNATAGQDYTTTSQTVTFAPSETSRIVMVPIINDDVYEGLEQFTARLSLPAGATGVMLGTADTATVDITDNDAVTVEFDPTSYTVSESDRYANITIVKRGQTTQTVSVSFTTADGNATAGQDYTTTSQTVTFAPSETSRIVMVPITDDSIGEGVEQFTARLSVPAGQSGVVLGEDMATVEITDDDSVTVEFDPASYTVSESDRYANITVVKRGQTTQTVNVTFSTADDSATAGQDYTTTSQTVTFAPSEDSRIVMVPIIDDNIGEGVEFFFSRLSVPAGQSGVVLGEDEAIIEITDDDPVTVEFEPTSYTVDESDRYANITIVKRGETTLPVIVSFTTADGSAIAGLDYTATAQPVTFAPSEMSQIVRVPIIEDARVELDETFNGQLTLVPGSSGVVLGAATTATVTITDDDNVMIQFDPTGYMVAEGSSTMLRIVKIGVADVTVSVSLSTVAGTADQNDFTPITNQVVTFQAGETERTVDFTSLPDDTSEGTENLTAVLSNPSARAMIGPQGTAMINITDDAAVIVQFDPISYTVTEADGAVVRFRVVKLTSTTQTVSVLFSTSPGTATDPADFSGLSNVPVTFAPGETVQYVNVSVANDAILEGDETFTATLTSTVSTVMIGSNNTATATIVDNDMVEIGFNPTSYTVNEDDGTVTLIVRKTGESEIPVTVDISTSAGSAGTGDFTGISRTLTFPAGGDDVMRVPVPITNDTIAEGTEEFFANLDNVDPNDVNLGDDRATIMIIDNDAVTIGFTSDNYRVREDNGTVTVCLMKTGTTAQDIPLTGRAFESTPPDAIAGQDFIAGSVNLVFPANATELCTTVPILNDTIAGEGDEEFTVDFTLDPGTSGVQPGRTTSTVTIIDNDVPTVVPSVPNVEVPENNGTVTVCFNTTTALASPHTIQVTAVEKTTGNIATAGDDFTPATRTITFPASATPTQACTSFNITDDTIGLEGNEMFTVRVDPSGPESWVTIIDDDVVEVEFVQPVYTVPEANNATVCLRSNSGSKRDVQVTVTVSEKTQVDAEDGLDFNSGTPRIVTFPAGNSGSEMCIVIHIIDDALEEQPEGFNVDFSFVNDTGVRKGPIAQTMVIIMDDEMIAVMFVNPNVTVPENNGTVTICLDVNRGISTPLPVVLIAEEKPSAGADAATDGDDFTAGVRTVTFPPSPNPGRVCTNFTILDDQIGLEGNERFTVRLNFTGQEACVTIVDDDVVEVEFVQDMYTVPEANGSATVCLRSNIETKRDLVIRVTASNKSPAEAEDGMDYISGTPRSITFPADVAGGSTRCTSFSIINDTIQEGNEGFNVDFTFVDGMGARKGTVAQSMVIITDDDVATVVPSVPNVEVPEDNGTVTVCFNTTTGIANPLTRQVTAEQKTTGNIATAGDDFTPATRTIRFPASATPTQACTSYNIINDTLGLEGNETFTVRVEPSGPESWVTIIDDDVVEVEFVQPVYTVPEANGSVTVCLQSNIGTEVNFNITVTVSEKSPVDAQDGLDFRSGPPRTVTFPAGDTGLTECIDIEIINDDVALENDEGFNVDFEFVPKEGVRKGSIPQSMVVITDEDVVVIDFQTASVTVNENNGTVTVCLEKDKDTDEPIVVQVTEDEGTASDGTDFIAEARNITFAPNARVACTSLPLIDDNTIEQPEAFRVNFMPLVPGTVQRRIMRGMREVANVTIIDDDAATNVTICSVTEPLIVSPFQISVNYSFRGSCEHVILSVCDGSPDLRITVDFLADTLQNGRIGASHMGRMYVSREDGTVSIDSNTEVISMSGSTMIYQGNVAITRDSAANRTTIEFQDLGVTIVHQLGQDPFFQVNISDTSTLGETCGLCGTTEGVLRHRNGNTANIMNRTEVDAFANSYLVAPRDQFLHSQRRECGQVTNDTVIGDPLFTVPINSDGRSLCFEIHGEPNRIFNLVSDQCTSINANYTAMNIPENGNIISQIGVRAVPSDGQCKNVRVELEGCRAFIGSAEVIGIRNEENVAVRRMRNRVRISVPNCDNLNLVMWVMCQNISGQPMIRFVITRGLNLRPTSHGLLGQFWNIPLNATRFNGTLDRSGGNLNEDELYVVTVTPQDGSPPRSFLAEQFVRTWENRPGPCLYAGNAQGGWSGEVNSLNSPVIQGGYKDYIVNELFETDYTYSRFDEQNCPLN